MNIKVRDLEWRIAPALMNRVLEILDLVAPGLLQHCPIHQLALLPDFAPHHPSFSFLYALDLSRNVRALS
jgi:hypothetical protein